MVIAGQGLGETLLRHDHERNAVGERPFLVRSLAMELDARFLKRLIARHDGRIEVGLQVGQRGQKFGPAARRGRQVSPSSVMIHPVVTMRPVKFAVYCTALAWPCSEGLSNARK